jgi:hypothetical protein
MLVELLILYASGFGLLPNFADWVSSPSRVKPKTIKFGIYCFCIKHAELKSKNKDGLIVLRNAVESMQKMGRQTSPFQMFEIDLGVSVFGNLIG